MIAEPESLEPSDGPSLEGSPHSPKDHRQVVEWFGLWHVPIKKWLKNRNHVPTGDIDDLAQEVFFRLVRYTDVAVVENPQGYLFRIAANVVNEWRDRSRVRNPHDDSWLEDLQIDAAAEPENFLVRQSINGRIQAAVDRLPARQRNILLLHVNEGLTYKQIASQQGYTYRLVLRELTRAYSALRMRLRFERFDV